ncbi:MAG: AbrB/MazE/SpoVT family DNA-binding domain-containing protein [Candidatus Omnitrophica bacterium]|nr:AbrB/MazE/SpoVT family DNA-binding domain-containing protein [Candidatus Omnitrophota bacterium]
MTIVDTTKMTSKGQVTIPNRVRKLLHLQAGCSVAFTVTKYGVVLVPCEVTARSPYSPKEWKKIEKLASEEGRTFSSPDLAKKHLAGL